MEQARRKMKVREAIFVFLIFGWAMCGPACSHHAQTVTAAHDAAGCGAACDGATVVETAPNGSLCRCWVPGGQYTFDFPDSDTKLQHARDRWNHMRTVIELCREQGLGWSETEDKTEMVCTKPEPAAIDPLRHAILPWDFPAPRVIEKPKRKSGERISA